MITVEALNRTYGTLHAVKNVSFQIEKGEVIGLLGPNGAGKTTIMKMICGFLEPSSGRISVDGTNVAEDTKVAQAAIGYLPENLPVYPEMTVSAYLEYAAGLRGVAPEKVGGEIKRVIDATDMHAKALEKISELSRGLKQRVGVAQALLGNPSVLILDEPTNGLDPTQTQQMRKLIRRLAESATVILSTHILSEVEAVCDRVLMVKSGELVLDERLEDIQRGDALAVQTSLSGVALQQALSDLSDAKWELSEQDGITHARITAKTQEGKSLASQAAKAIIAAGGELYHLGYEQRDLETLFREIHTGEGVANAA